MSVELAALWCLYAAALEGRKRREHARLTRSLAFMHDMHAVREQLARLGLCL